MKGAPCVRPNESRRPNYTPGFDAPCELERMVPCLRQDELCIRLSSGFNVVDLHRDLQEIHANELRSIRHGARMEAPAKKLIFALRLS